MAVSVPREIYTLGAVKFDTQPLAQLQAQLVAKKAAKEEALNKYYSDLQGKINLAGVRTQDLQGPLGGITQDVESWKQEWLKNKDQISKGGLAQQEHLSKFQNILRKIDQSKNRAKTDLELGKMKVEGKYDPDDDDLQVQQKISYSIYDPRSYKQDGVTEFGIGDLSPSVPAFDATRQNQFFSFAQKGKELGEVADTTREPIKEKVGGKETGWVIVPIKKEFSKDQIIGIANEAAELVKSIDPNNPRKAADVSARKYYSQVLNNPQSEEFVRLKNTYDKYFPGAIMDTPEEVAKAAAAIKAEGVGQTTTRRINPEESYKEKALFQAFLKAQGTQSGQTTGIKGNAIDEIGEVKTVVLPMGGSIVNGIVRNSKGERYSGQATIQYDDLPANLISVLEQNKTPVVEGEPVVLGFQDGVIIGIAQEGKPVVGRKTVENAQLKYSTEPLKGPQMTFGLQQAQPTQKAPSKENTYTIKGKKYKEGELMKMGYTKQQISQYLNK